MIRVTEGFIRTLMIRVVLRVQQAGLSIVHTQAFHGSYLNDKTHTWLEFVGFVPKVYSFNMEYNILLSATPRSSI